MSRFGTGVLLVPLLAIAASTPACAQDDLPPNGQLVVYIDTNAPLTRGEESADPLTTHGMFDSLRAEIITPTGELACADCQRDFVVDQRQIDEGLLSFGARLPASTSGYRLRARLFVAEARSGDRPRSDAAIDIIFALPVHGAEGRVEVTAYLPFEELGVEADLASPGVPVASGKALRGQRAIPVTRTTCLSPARAGEVCVPGGVYWAGRAFALLGVDVEPWRAVVISPFFLDEREVTVGDLRASALATAAEPVRMGKSTAECTYTETAGANENLPVTCLTLAVATAFCAKRGAVLPSVAQTEYVRSGLDGKRYVWGADPPTCEDAVWARGGDSADSDRCAVLGGGPQRAGTGTRDRLVLPTGVIVDLTGNVAEMLRDSSTSICRSPGLLVDPTCGRAGGRYSVAGGSFAAQEVELSAPMRLAEEYRAPHPRTGFRCARPVEVGQ